MVTNGQHARRHHTSADRTERHAARHARRRLKPEVRRAELVNAALTVLRGRDPGEVRVEDVTREAGAAKGTFYLYFSSWNELLVAVRSHVLSLYTNEVLDRFASVGTASQWWTTLKEECARFVDFHVELGTVHKAIFHGTAWEYPIDPEQEGERVVSRILRQGMALGACRPLDTDIAASLVFSLLHTTADAVGRSHDREARLEVLVELLHTWLQAPEAGGSAPDEAGDPDKTAEDH
jgi:AcrR family transcriptional regulator